MLGTLALALTLAAADPRPALVQLELAQKNREALARAEQELAARPEPSHRLGLDYLRGHLLNLLGRPQDALEAFAAAMVATPQLNLYSRYRLAVEQQSLGHPEVAAGLVSVVARDAPSSSPLLPDAVRLLCSTLASGGDCRLIRALALRNMAAVERRLVEVARADCAQRAGDRELARSILVRLIEETTGDEAARAAAERLAGLVSAAERGRLPRLLGLTFQQHRDFDRALRHLPRGAGAGPASEELAARYAMGRSYFWQGRFSQAAVLFGQLAESAAVPEDRARALYQQGRCYELMGQPRNAAESFRLAYLASPAGDWAAPALVAGVRLDWHNGNEAGALALYSLLASNWTWRDSADRAALFLASSDLVRGRRDRARSWLVQAARGSRDDQIEVAYWRGRLAELAGDPPAAVAAYLEALRADRFHPMGEAALARLKAPGLARAAAAEARRLAASARVQDLLGAWLLQGDGDALGRKARARLVKALAADRTARPFLRMAEVPVERWPLWREPLGTPEETLLGLGIWSEGAPAVAGHFPPADPSLGLTGALLLARAGETGRSVAMAESVRIRLPGRLPSSLLPAAFQTLLYPLAYRPVLMSEAAQRGIDPHLLAAVVREESQFDPYALSPAAARGLTQFVLPTARRLAAQLEMGALDPDDLYRPELAIALGAAHLAELDRAFGGERHLTVTAYNAGEAQTRLWRAYCYSAEPEEFFSKVGFGETRDYLRRVLTSWAQYGRLY